MKALGIIFSNIHGRSVPELTRHRTQASVPFGGRYRLIDFVLSGMVNSGIDKVGIITKTNYQSLMDHIGSGKNWDLSRRNGGVVFLPPYGAEESTNLYTNRLEALKGVISFFKRSTEEYVVMSDCDILMTADYEDMLERHIERNADITVMYAKKELYTDGPVKKHLLLDVDEHQRVRKVNISERISGMHDVYLNIMCMSRLFMIHILEEAVAFGYKSFSEDVLRRNTDTFKIFGYYFDGYFASIDSLSSYFQANMDMLDKSFRDLLFRKKGFPIYTKVKDSPPSRYTDSGRVQHSLIADGCVIEGEVEDSIIFRGVKIGAGCKVKSSIIMQDTIISRGAELNCVIADKNVFIKEKRILSGCETLPYYISKNSIL